MREQTFEKLYMLRGALKPGIDSKILQGICSSTRHFPDGSFRSRSTL